MEEASSGGAQVGRCACSQLREYVPRAHGRGECCASSLVDWCLVLKGVCRSGVCQ